MPPAFTDASLLEHVRKLPHARATYKQLVRELRLHGEKRDDLDETLDRLCDKGLLAELRSGHFVAVGENTEYVAGRLSIHRDGFGFLIPDAGKNDIFLPPSEAAKGMNGDRTLVHITRIGREGRAEGEILRILRRAHMTVVGEFRIRKRGNFVVPSDERLQQWIVIPEGMDLPAVPVSTAVALEWTVVMTASEACAIVRPIPADHATGSDVNGNRHPACESWWVCVSRPFHPGVKRTKLIGRDRDSGDAVRQG